MLWEVSQVKELGSLRRKKSLGKPAVRSSSGHLRRGRKKTHSRGEGEEFRCPAGKSENGRDGNIQSGQGSSHQFSVPLAEFAFPEFSSK